jgi:hypothetical protein
MSESAVGEIIEGLWRFEALHPEWTEEESGADGWEQSVAWWVIETPGGLVLVDPLVDDWEALDRLLADRGGCAGVIRTCHWHQRSIPEAGLRGCPESWTQPAGGPARLRRLLAGLTNLPLQHVLVSHGPLVLDDGFVSLRAATA